LTCKSCSSIWFRGIKNI